MESDSRRSFLAGLGVAAVASTTFSSSAEATEPTDQLSKQIVPGSPYPTFSRAVRCGGMVYVSGVLGQRPGTRDLVSPEAPPQFRQALENLKASVETAGSSMDRVVKCNCFLTEASDFPRFNEVYVKFFSSQPPARSTVIVKELVVPGAKLEIDCVAFV